MNDKMKPTQLQMVTYFVKLGLTVFGGPIPLTNAMHRDLIEGKKWFDEATFQQGLALAQFAPGPMATQLAIYLGWFHSGMIGATLVSVALILPIFIIVVLIGALYVYFGQLPWIQHVFYGTGGAVVAIIIKSGVDLTRRSLHKNFLLLWVAFINMLFVIFKGSELWWAFIGSGLLIALIKTKKYSSLHFFSLSFFPAWCVTGLSGQASNETLRQILIFFLKAGTFIFGSGLVIVPFLHGGVVVQHHWLTQKQFLDAIAVGMITPGPVVITVAFVGYLIAGWVGASVASFGIFFPCYILTILIAPFFHKISKNEFAHDFIEGISAAAIGAIGGAAVILGKKTLIDFPTIIIFISILFGLWKFKKIPQTVWIFLSGFIGILFCLF